VFRKLVALAVRFDLNPPSVQKLKNVIRTKEGSCDVEYTLVSLPLYMVEELPPILDDLRREQWDPRRSNMKTVKSFHEKSGWLRVKKAWPENLIHSSFWS
jgi:hypothetical protein